MRGGAALPPHAFRVVCVESEATRFRACACTDDCVLLLAGHELVVFMIYSVFGQIVCVWPPSSGWCAQRGGGHLGKRTIVCESEREGGREVVAMCQNAVWLMRRCGKVDACVRGFLVCRAPMFELCRRQTPHTRERERARV